MLDTTLEFNEVKITSDGVVTHVEVDGIVMPTLSAITFHHAAPKVATLTLTTPIGCGECLRSSCVEQRHQALAIADDDTISRAAQAICDIQPAVLKKFETQCSESEDREGPADHSPEFPEQV